MNGVRAGFERRTRRNARAEGKWFVAKFIRQSGGGVKGTNRGMDGSVYADWFLFGRSRATLIGRESKKRGHWGRVNEADEHHGVYRRARERLIVSLYVRMIFRQEMM